MNKQSSLLFVAILFCLSWLMSVAVSVQAQGDDNERGIHRTPLAALTTEGEELLLYKESHALLIGASRYEKWSALPSIPGELDELEAVLSDQGFSVERLVDPTSETLKSGVESFINRHGYEPENRLLIFFSGHGHSEGSRGFFVPVDAPFPEQRQGFRSRALSMAQVIAWARNIDAKHVLFVFDSCFSGSVFQAKSLPRMSDRYIRRATDLPVRQFLTAGSAGELVPARSTFTPALVEAIRGEGDMNDDGYVTGNELGVHLSQLLPRYVDQTPQFGTIRDYELGQGDFVFFSRVPKNTVQAAAQVTESTEPAEVDLPIQFAELPMQSQLDAALWSAAEQDNSERGYQLYLEQMPLGVFAGYAARRMNKLKQAREVEEGKLAAQEVQAVAEQKQQAQAQREAKREQAAKKARAAEMARQLAIDRLVASARRNILSLRLTEPEGNNANSQLNELEKLDPQHVVVAEGRLEIQAHYMRWIDKELERGNVLKAEQYLESLALVTSSGANAEQMRARLDEYHLQEANHAKERESASQQALAEAEETRRRDDEQARERESQRRHAAEELDAAQKAEMGLSLTRGWRRGIQIALDAAGFDVGIADGLWGARTREGIQEWQSTRGLLPTGYLNDDGYRKMMTELGVKEVEVSDQQQNVVASQTTITRSAVVSASTKSPEMVLVKSGKFNLGNTNVGTVSLKGFEISKYEVTVGQYNEFVADSGYLTDSLRNAGGVYGCNIWLSAKKDWQWTPGSGVGFTQTNDHPATCLSWNDAQAYIKWINATTTGGYRLPSEAEWEYAATAGISGEWSFPGSEGALCTYGNGADKSTAADLFWSNSKCEDGYKRTSPVGKFKPNGRGLYDMYGNVGEWVGDCWHSNFKGVPKDGQAWTKACDQQKRVVRGGGWFHSPDVLKSRHRYWFNKEYRDSSLGFRVARSP